MPDLEPAYRPLGTAMGLCVMDCYRVSVDPARGPGEEGAKLRMCLSGSFSSAVQCPSTWESGILFPAAAPSTNWGPAQSKQTVMRSKTSIKYVVVPLGLLWSEIPKQFSCPSARFQVRFSDAAAILPKSE
jgi:hypothetical protein